MESECADARPGRWLALSALIVGGTFAQGLGLLVGGIAGVATLLVVVPREATVSSVDFAHLPPTALLVLIVASIVTVSFMLVLTAIAVPLIRRTPIRARLGLRGASPGAYAWTAVGVLGSAPLGDACASLMAWLAPSWTIGSLEMINVVLERAPIWVLVPAFALLPAVSEELFFRGMWQRAFGRGGLAIALSAGAFALFHVDPVHVAGVLPVGIFLAWAAARTDSTYVTIAGHTANNLAAVLVAQVAAVHVGFGADVAMPWWAYAIGFVVAALAAERLHAHGVRDVRDRSA